MKKILSIPIFIVTAVSVILICFLSMPVRTHAASESDLTLKQELITRLPADNKMNHNEIKAHIDISHNAISKYKQI